MLNRPVMFASKNIHFPSRDQRNDRMECVKYRVSRSSGPARGLRLLTTGWLVNLVAKVGIKSSPRGDVNHTGGRDLKPFVQTPRYGAVILVFVDSIL